jgi:alpha-tubulin suppressor-like RCC1 family protein
VECWGYNGYGELGNGTTTQSDVPVQVKSIATATAVTGGSYSFCARLSTGHVECWGKNGRGQLGNGTTTDSHVPVAVSGISTARGVSSGWNSFCALLTTGHLDCWGDNGYGQLGNASWMPYSDVPTPVVGIGGVTSVTGGGNSESRCAVLSTGRVECWGVNIYGELGNGTTTGSNAPVPVKNITTATTVADDNFDGASFCARLGTGQVDCWGYNLHGELGNGTMTDSHLPVPVKSLTSGTTVVGGDSTFCARLSTGHLDCWGYNGYGQLGNGTTTDSDVPVAPHGISSAATLIYGYDSFCAVLSTKAVDCWGHNATGQLGNGSTADSDVPVPVLAAS